MDFVKRYLALLIVLAVLIFCACSGATTSGSEMLACDDCGRFIPEDLALRTEYGAPICPHCAFSGNMELISCDYCDEKIPENLMFEYNEESVCPNCVYSSYEPMISPDVGKCHECGNFYRERYSYGLGLCEDCGQHIIVECKMCTNPTYEWSNDTDFALCPDCLGYALEHTKIEKILRQLYE